MKTRACIGILTVYLLCAAALAQAQTPSTTAEVHVTTFIFGTRTPIPGARVSIATALECGGCLLDLPDNEEELLAYLTQLAVARGLVVEGGPAVRRTPAPAVDFKATTAVADEKGAVVFRSVKFGRQQISSTAFGYFGGMPPGRPDGFVGGILPETTTTIAVDEKQRNVEVSLFLMPFPTIAGHVRDKNGRPAANVSVWLRLASIPPERNGVGSPREVVVTDASGNYVLKPGTLGEFLIGLEGMDPAKAARVSLKDEKNLPGVDFEFETNSNK